MSSALGRHALPAVNRLTARGAAFVATDVPRTPRVCCARLGGTAQRETIKKKLDTVMSKMPDAQLKRKLKKREQNRQRIAKNKGESRGRLLVRSPAQLGRSSRENIRQTSIF